MKFSIRNRWTDDVQFEAEIEAGADTPASIKIGLAVKWALSTGANLTDANLTGANLAGANLTRANLTRAYLTDANLTRVNEIPAIDRLDSKVLAAIDAGGELNMSSWHTCDTTHCRAGWAITLAGDAGRRLEDAYGPAAAGALIYAKSYPTLRVPNFYASNEDALADIKQRAASDAPAAA